MEPPPVGLPGIAGDSFSKKQELETLTKTYQVNSVYRQMEFNFGASADDGDEMSEILSRRLSMTNVNPWLDMPTPQAGKLSSKLVNSQSPNEFRWVKDEPIELD